MQKLISSWWHNFNGFVIWYSRLIKYSSFHCQIWHWKQKIEYSIHTVNRIRSKKEIYIVQTLLSNRSCSMSDQNQIQYTKKWHENELLNFICSPNNWKRIPSCILNHSNMKSWQYLRMLFMEKLKNI